MLGSIGVPCSCDSELFHNNLKAVICEYVNDYNYKVLAERYAYNIASGRFLWRNRMAAEEVKIVVNKVVSGQTVKTWEFDGLNYSLKDFDSTDSEVSSLGEIIAEGLRGDSYVAFEIDAYARMGRNMEVFPSQEFVNEDDKDKQKVGRKSKTLTA